MINKDTPTDIVNFLVRLRRIDNTGLSARDIVFLYAVIANPGLDANSIRIQMGIKVRGQVQSNIWRLIRHGLIEDRRTENRKAVATILHPTPKGIALWEDIIIMDL